MDPIGPPPYNIKSTVLAATRMGIKRCCLKLTALQIQRKFRGPRGPIHVESVKSPFKGRRMVGGWREERSEDEETLVEREEGQDRPVPSYHPRYLLYFYI